MASLKFIKDAAGVIRERTNNDAVTYELYADGIFRGVGVDDLAVRVVTTGWAYVRSLKATMYQTTSGEWIELSEGWKVAGTDTNTYSRKDAQALVDKIIKNNKVIIANNLLCARYAEKLTADQRNRVRALQTRLEQRNSALIESGLCEGLEQSYPTGYSELQPYLNKLMTTTDSGIYGVGSVTVTIIVVALVIASLSTAAYFAYKAYAAQSEQDVKYSKELTKILTEKLTPEEYQQLMSETKGIVTKARIWQSIGNYGRLITFAAVGVGAFFLYKLFTKNGKES